ncbi:MAG: endopeptidase La [Acidobacteriaceae bacterium]|nr:endopeptidase La [Acidobacteriaceae bacterium]
MTTREKSETKRLPMMPIRDVVIFPHMMTPFVVGRESSVRALEEALAGEKKIFLATQHDASVDEPRPDEIYSVGTIANIVQSLKLSDGNIKVLVEGSERAKVVSVSTEDGYFRATVKTFASKLEAGVSLESLTNRVTTLFEQYVKLSQNLNYETMIATIKVDDPGKLADTVGANLQLTIEEKQELLEIFDPIDRLTRVAEMLDIEIEKLSVDRTIQGRVKRQMERAQKEYYLNEKIKAIQKELGRGEKSEYDDLKKKIETAGMTADALEKALTELKRLEQMPPMSAESTVSRNYLDWLLAVPWKQKTHEIRDLKFAREVLESDHYGLEKIKERILEFLAVRRLVKNPKGSILCFVGPPGVGKTSLGMSIAKATGRKFVRLSLGGVRDEAEIRGHRRTYIGALPGQVIQMMKKAGTKNPVFMLDEIDKMSTDFRGDPSAALLEVLDPAQNDKFMDHYLDVDYDLSEVLFVATANVMHTIPAPLQDRMEVIRLSGYTELEKAEIARRFLITKQKAATGLSETQVDFTAEGVSTLIQGYTRESGVRNLEREIGNVCRKVARKVVEASVDDEPETIAKGGELVVETAAKPAKKGKKAKAVAEAAEVPPVESKLPPVAVTPQSLLEMLGPPRFRDTQASKKNDIGATVGLAWTEVGGSILTTEVTVMEGRGKLTLTGKLGDVMQESAQAAMSYVRSRANSLGLARDFYRNLDIHLHVPEGAIPKDGPSAGITIATSMCSALTNIPVRGDIAMTGEITVRGKVLPIGGLKEKMLAANRQGIFELVLPKDNEKDLHDIPETIRKEMKLHFVESMDEVLQIALERAVTPLPIVPPATAQTDAPVSPEDITH